MIKKISIQNFKSIKDIAINCKRVNLFIGDPNTGKSNILEALALFALPYARSINKLVRNNDLSNLFHENDLSNSILVQADSYSFEIEYKRDLIKFLYEDEGRNKVLELELPIQAQDVQDLNPIFDFKIHPYFFKTLGRFDRRGYDFLYPPHGDNLFSILQSNKPLRSIISEIVQDRGFKLSFRQATSEIEISKEENNILTTYPFGIISDTLQRIIFYVSAMESNAAGAALVFEEPESNVFPYYTKYMAERIASDLERQYFISTHNPYFLQSIIEKTLSSDLVVNLVQMEGYQTQIIQLSERGKQEVLNLNNDVFLNFDSLVNL